MRCNRFLVFSLLTIAWVLAGTSGCSGKAKKLKVTGRLTQAGQPFKKPEGGPPVATGLAGIVQLSFYPLPAEGTRPADPSQAGSQPTFAVVQEDGSYVVELPPGKYLAVVAYRPQGPASEDALKNRFSFANSKITVEVSGDTSLDIELDKYK